MIPWKSSAQEATDWLVNDESGVRIGMRLLESGEWELGWSIKVSSQADDQPATLPIIEEWAKLIQAQIVAELQSAGCVWNDEDDDGP